MSSLGVSRLGRSRPLFEIMFLPDILQCFTAVWNFALCAHEPHASSTATSSYSCMFLAKVPRYRHCSPNGEDSDRFSSCNQGAFKEDARLNSSHCSLRDVQSSDFHQRRETFNTLPHTLTIEETQCVASPPDAPDKMKLLRRVALV